MIDIYKPSEFAETINGRHFFLLHEYTILYWNEEVKEFVIANIDPNREDYTFEDYLKLPDYAPYELTNGKLIFMAAPSLKHQEVAGELYALLLAYNKKHKLGKVFISPCDVRFDENNNLQPDLLFVSIDRNHILSDKRVEGSPDMTVEILSTNKNDDLITKMAIYAKFGVLEYWIIDLKTPKIDVYENKNSEMVLVQTAQEGGSIRSKVIKDFVLNLNDIF